MSVPRVFAALAVLATIGAAAPAGAGSAPEPAARLLFGARPLPSDQPPEPHGGYARGCVAGARELPETAPGWQAMRLGRNRNWAHPEALRFIERLSLAARDAGWPRLLIGDISQPRGGPMTGGHRSHQTGLDIDIWLQPGPAEPMSVARRETFPFRSVVAADRRTLNDRWTEAHRAVLRAAGSDPAVARIFVNAAIKKRLCEVETGDRAWLRRIRPWWSHDGHFHVRLACPRGAGDCVDQDPPPPGDGCDATLDWWFSDEALHPAPPAGPKKRRPDLLMADLPAACRGVLDAR